MASVATVASPINTLGDLICKVGDLPLDRIRFAPFPGTATVQDVNSVHETEGVLCELIDGVLVEKVMGFGESQLTVRLLSILYIFVHDRNLGIVTGADGTVELMADRVRIPDAAFTKWERFPDRKPPTQPVPRVVPNLAIEVLSPSNTAAEMSAKRHDYFHSGVEVVWEIDPSTRTVAVFSTPADAVVLKETDVLDGGTVLPAFRLALAELFLELDRKG